MLYKSHITVIALIFFPGCFIIGPIAGPDYSPPEIKVQDVWYQETTKGLAEGKSNIQTWWFTLQDPVLNDFIQRASKNNLKLKEAFTRIQEARALRGIATGERFPDIDGTGLALRKRSSHEFRPPTDQKGRSDDFFVIGGNASWEIDFWGRISRSIESADAALQASIEDYRDVLVLLYAEVAQNYVTVRTLQDRIRFASNNAVSQRKTLKLTKDRFEAGIAPELDLHQAELNLAKTESLIPDLQRLLTQSINRLGVLLGQQPDAFHKILKQPASIPKPSSEEINIGLPVDLLRQRPDIRKAERELAAQTAQIGVATADLYPSFSLFGSFTLAANEFDRVFEYSRSRSHIFGPIISWNIFDGGRIRNQIKAERARTEQALIHYKQTVLDALEEVENAMIAYIKERERQKMLTISVKAAQKSVDLVKTLYISGLTDFQNVLDMERSLFVQQDELADSEGMVTNYLISIYKALGGGWPQESFQSDTSSDRKIDEL